MTPIQKRTKDLNWMSLEGKTLDEKYVLGKFLEADDRHVVFKAQVKSGSPAAAIVKVFKAGGSSSEEQVALWKAIQEVKHPNLRAILGAGRTSVEDEDLIYVALEPPDEQLDKILQERPLDTEEAGELVTSLSGGLEALHAAGFVHGSLSPEQVVGVGDAIKISTDGAHRAGPGGGIEVRDIKYRAPESVSGNVTREADVWCLGATLFEAMTQKKCGSDCRAEAAKLPAPFGTIVHRCLYSSPEARCSLADVAQLHENRPRAFSAAAGAGAGAAVGASAGLGSVRRESADTDYFVPYSEEVETRPSRAIVSESEAARHPNWRTWALVALLVLIAAAMIWLARPRRATQGGAVATAVTKAPPQLSAARRSAAQPSARARGAASTIAPAAVRVAPLASVRAHAERNSPRGGGQTQYLNGPVWRVVTYTYDRAADAENRARAINEKHPDLKAEVFSPNGNAGPYLVVVGGQLNRETAAAVRQRALRLGLPRDSYLQNYKQ